MAAPTPSTADGELERLIAEQAREMRRGCWAGLPRGTVSFDERIVEYRPASGLRCGTLGGYTHGRCRCDKCREAWRTYQREWKRRWRARLKAQGIPCP